MQNGNAMQPVSKHTITNNTTTSEEVKQRIFEILETVSDPEVPVLSVIDLGIIRNVEVVRTTASEGLRFTVFISITPTYTGCPAIDVMKINIRMALLQEGFTDLKFEQVLSPAWTTDWISSNGKEKLKAYGIAPPQYSKAVASTDSFQDEEAIQCPLCNSYHTRLVSQFGSTACKALYQCNDCKEPFDYFKCH
jgi:ring-1,2-phenylacetyl-CoA epoxidase subunit PaaD